MPSPPERPARACGACLRRTRLVELLAPHVERARHGRPLPQILALSDEELLAAVGGRHRPRFVVAIADFDAEQARVLTARAGLVALCVHAPAYPPQLRAADDRSAVLFVAGDPARLPAADQPAIAIVGARRATPYGLEVARALGRGLAAAGVTVVSGLALGVDSAAHSGAVEVGGPTVAVLAGGADVPYPASKAGLYRRIVGSGAPAAGCVISEMPPGYVPFKWGFPARNRIIAGLAGATIVVEAAARSGSLITAEMAQDIGRLVAAVPGPVTSPMSAGTNALLRDGAEVVRDAQDVLDTVLGPGMATLHAAERDSLEPPLRAVLDRLGAQPATPAALLRPGDDVDATLAALAELELRGLARRAHGGVYVRALAS